MNQNLGVNKTNFHMKVFALGLALKQRRNVTRKLTIVVRLVFKHLAYRTFKRTESSRMRLPRPERVQNARVRVQRAGWYQHIYHFFREDPEYRRVHSLWRIRWPDKYRQCARVSKEVGSFVSNFGRKKKKDEQEKRMRKEKKTVVGTSHFTFKLFPPFKSCDWIKLLVCK